MSNRVRLSKEELFRFIDDKEIELSEIKEYYDNYDNETYVFNYFTKHYKIHQNGVIESINKINPIIRNPRKGDYMRIGLSRNRDVKWFSIHRLVAIKFIPNPLNKPCVNHKDGDKLNNNVNNLEWVTYSENRKHAVENGLGDPRITSIKPVNQMTIEGVFIKKYPSMKQAHIETGCSQSKISSVCNNHRKQTGGFKWEFSI